MLALRWVRPRPHYRWWRRSCARSATSTPIRSGRPVTMLSSDADCWQQVERPELDGAINGLWKEEAYGEVVQLKNLPFVIRYEAEGDHSGLMWHKDNADVSFIVLLSEPEEFEVEGGGHAATRFEAFGDVELTQVTPPAQRSHFRCASACVADRPWKAAFVRVLSWLVCAGAGGGDERAARARSEPPRQRQALRALGLHILRRQVPRHEAEGHTGDAGLPALSDALC